MICLGVRMEVWDMRRYHVERAYRGGAILIERFGTRGPLEGLQRALYRY